MLDAHQTSLLSDDCRMEIEELRSGLLLAFLPLVQVGLWLWYYVVIFQRLRYQISFATPAAITAATYAVFRLRQKHYRLACWLFLASLVAIECLLVADRISATPMAFGILVVVIANALLGTSDAFLVAALTWCAVTATQRLAGGARPEGTPVETLVLYFVTWGATWGASRPLVRSVQSALSGWTRAREALSEVRQRRGEIYHALRALEEATSRIERMNRELIAARREAEVARALKARFAATVSHELRGPLNLILGFSRLMALAPEKYGQPLPVAYRADIDTIYRSSQHLATLVDDILDLSQIEAERLPLVKDRIDLQEDVISKAIEIMQPLAERKGLYLRQEVEGEMPWIVADAVRLRQVLVNLLSNALRFTEQGGVTVRAALQSEHLLVSVQDTGRGIAEEDMERLFEEFQQRHSAEGQKGPGSGLGLSISKQLIELHGGEMWAESQPGAGATFSFTLPLPGVAVAHTDLVKAEAVEYRENAHEICLFVHSDTDLVRLLARHIEGYRIVGVPNVESAWPLIEKLHPRAIVTTPELAASLSERLSSVSFDLPLITCGLPGAPAQNDGEMPLSYLIKPIAPEALTTLMGQVERPGGETTVLVVDDDPDAVQLIERMLTALPRPYRILKAYDGLQALEVMQGVVPDVVFMDLLMPGLDGRQTIARMRADPRTQDVPVVIISAQDRDEDGLTLTMPISVQRRLPVDVASGARCLQALLDTLRPTYLPRPAAA